LVSLPLAILPRVEGVRFVTAGPAAFRLRRAVFFVEGEREVRFR